MWSWIRRPRAKRDARWVIALDGQALRLQFGSAQPVALPWSLGDERAQARLLAVLRQAVRAGRPGPGQLSLQAEGPAREALQAVLTEVLGVRAASEWSLRTSNKIDWRTALRPLPLRGLVVLFILFAAGLLLPIEPAAVRAPAPAPTPLTSALSGLSPATPVGWLESLAQQAGAASAADWRLLELRADREGTFQLRLQLNEASSAPVLGGSSASANPGAARVEALRQLMDRQAGRVSVSVQAGRSELLLAIKPTAGAASGTSPVLTADQFTQAAVLAGLSQRPSAAPGVWAGPVQSVAALLARLGPALSWSQLALLQIERDPEQPGLARLRLVLQGGPSAGAKP